MQKKAVFVVAIIVAIAIPVAVAVGSGGTRESLVDENTISPSQEVTNAFPTFGEPPSQPDDVTTLQQLKRSFATVSSTSAIAKADFSKARVVSMAGTDAPAWIAPAGDHVCVFIPDPVDGFGAGCVTLQEIRDGHGFSFLGGSRETYVVALVPEGDDAPSVSSTSDSGARLTTTGNASGGLLPNDAVIRTSNATISLESLQQPSLDKPAE